MSPSKIILSILGLLLMASTSQAFFSTFDTADTIKPETYELGLEPQWIFNHFPGGNVIAHLNTGANENGNLKFLLGSGSTVFQAGAFYKWIPFPDFGNQPGIGFFAGALYASEYGNSDVNLRFHPLISKRFKTDDMGYVEPYGSIPFGVSFYDGNTVWPVQLALGTRWFPPGSKHLNFLAEVGIELSNAFSYVSVGLSVPFDDWEHIRLD